MCRLNGGRMEPFSLSGNHVKLLPLSVDQHDNLVSAARDGELWRLWYTSIPSPAEMEAEIARRLGLREKGTMLPFTVIQRSTNRVVGMTTYMNIDATVPRLEIGATWYAQQAQRTPVNTESKLLLLRHAFEELNCDAVELRTHFMNHQSRRAIERLGAKLDRILRNHQRAKNGTLRDTCVYSILSSEWLAVKSALNWTLEKHSSK